MRPIGGILFLAFESYGQDEDITGRQIGGPGLDIDFIDFVEDGGGLDGASYDYTDYTAYDGTDEGRSRPTAAQLEALRLAAEANAGLLDPDGYEYIVPSDEYEFTDYVNFDYSDGATGPDTEPIYALDGGDYNQDTASIDYVFSEAVKAEAQPEKSRRPIGSSSVKPVVKQLVGTHFATTGYTCYSHHAVGMDTATTVAAFSGGTARDCRNQGNGDFCFLEVRTQAGQVRQIITGCAQADYCSGLRNFGDTDNTAPFVPQPTRSDQCKPTTYAGGNTFMLNKRFRNQESVCRTCFYTNDGTIDGTNSHGLHLSGTDLFILDGAGTPAAIHTTSVTAWQREMWYALASTLQTA